MENKKELEEKAIQWFIQNRLIYKKLAIKIETILTEILELKGISYHILTSRTKSIDSFKKKIENDKYDDPLNQITDLAGVRIITYVEDEVNFVCETIEDIFDIDKANSLDKSKELGIDKVGYKSVHYVSKLKEDRVRLPEYKIFENKFFEIQVRTILQHAWAEIEHDRNYKFSGKLPDEITRRFKLLAGALEISDREFNNIAKEIDNISKEVEKGTIEGKLNFELNSTSLKQYVLTKFKDLKEAGIIINYKGDKNILQELQSYGIMSLEDLDKIIPEDFISFYINTLLESQRTVVSKNGLLRLLLMINDYNKYFTNAWLKDWSFWTKTKDDKKIFEHYKIDWSKIEEKFKVSYADKNLPSS